VGHGNYGNEVMAACQDLTPLVVCDPFGGVFYTCGAMPVGYCALRGLNTGKYLQLLPHVHGTDGFFAAVMEKV
jgi:16S rRNA C967 or C1407 C5-methylase (RsmB/RsmF family)